MPNVCVEPRPKGRPEGSHIEDFVVEDHADHILARRIHDVGVHRADVSDGSVCP
jgi:hypothetical protein